MSKADRNHSNDLITSWEKKKLTKRLSKRLAYILRYGAITEGLDVDENGYVSLVHLCTTRLLQSYSEAEVLEYIKSSTSYKHTKRYDYHERNGQIYVRAAYLRNFEKSVFHRNTNVKTLFEFSVSCILDNLDDFDLEDFPDEHILRMMIRRLKIEKKLSSKALRVLLAPTITHLDLEGIYLNNNILRLVWTQCPHLKAVSLRDCGYIITDTVLAQFTKNLPCLEKLNLCRCTHLTNKSLTTLVKNLPQLHTLHITRVPSLTFKSVLEFLQKSSAIKFLDVYYLRTTPEEYNCLVEIAQTKKMTLLLREPKKTDHEMVKEEFDVEEGDGCLGQLTDPGYINTENDDDDNDEEEEEEDGEEWESDNDPSSDEDDNIMLVGLLNEIWSDQEEDELSLGC
ncbi:F-box protein SKP2B-like [Elysia marginata]|uniref:2'-phosphotransferase n=1 Tax=Elysia marginata TaxID=1093978 RepID=A0AAV4HF01_9GAST|nr:F-box protein SKP2B-like [Elysia marginata]